MAVVQAGQDGMAGRVDDLRARGPWIGVDLVDRPRRRRCRSPSMSTEPGSSAAAPVIGNTMPLRISESLRPARSPIGPTDRQPPVLQSEQVAF